MGGHPPAPDCLATPAPLLLVDGHNLLWGATFGFPAPIYSRDKTRPLTGLFAFAASWSPSPNGPTTGDPADDIPGVRGIGVKTAATLLEGGLALEDLPASGRLDG